MNAKRSEKHVTVGNVTYLWGKKGGSSRLDPLQPGAASESEGTPGAVLVASPFASSPFLDSSESSEEAAFTFDEQTALKKLQSSLSGSWTPTRLRTKIAAMGFSGEKAKQVFRLISEGDSYDALWVATREVHRRLKKGQGEQRLHAELRIAGFDEDVIAQALAAVSEEDWREALAVAMDSSSIRSKEGPALQQALARRGFSSSQIHSYLKQRRGTV